MKGFDKMKTLSKLLAILLLAGTLVTPVFPIVETEVNTCKIMTTYHKKDISSNGVLNYYYYLTVNIDGNIELFEVGYDIYEEYINADTIEVQTTRYSKSWFSNATKKYCLIV